MGTTSDKLTYLNGTKTAIRENLNLGGANITTNDTFRSYASTIKSQLEYYLANGLDVVWDNWDKVSASGTTLSINNTIQAPMKIVYGGNTQQNGDPTPDNPIPVQVVSGNNSIKVEGKNLLLNDNPNTPDANYSTTGAGSQPIQYDSLENGYYTTTARQRIMELKSNISYTFSIDTKKRTSGSNFSIYIYYYNTNTSTSSPIQKSFNVSSTNFERLSWNFTIPSDYNALRVIVYSGVFFKDMQLEKSSTATTYTPYVSQTYPINLGSIELCKIGNYEDKIFKAIKGNEIYDSLTTVEQATLDYGKWYLRKAIGKFDLSTISFWNKQANGNFYNMNFAQNNGYISGIGLSNLFNYSTTSWVDNCFGITSAGVLWIATSDTTITSYDEFITWLANKNAIMYGALTTPTYTKITDELLTYQLEQIKYSYNSQTNISQTPNDMPFILDVNALESM